MSDNTTKENQQLCYWVSYVGLRSCELTRSHAVWLFLVGAHEEHGIPAKAQTELLQRLIQSTDHVRGKWWNYQKGNKFSFKTCRIMHTEWWRLFWNIINNITENWLSLILSNQNWFFSSTFYHNYINQNNHLGNRIKNGSFFCGVIWHTIFFWCAYNR